DSQPHALPIAAIPPRAVNDRTPTFPARGADPGRGPAEDQPARPLRRERRVVVHPQLAGNPERLGRDLPHAARQLPERVRSLVGTSPGAGDAGVAGTERPGTGGAARRRVGLADLVNRAEVAGLLDQVEPLLVGAADPVSHRL